MKNNIICSLFVLIIFGMSFEFACADAWWGEGYRPKNWVLQNGGTIIYFTVTGTEHPEDYKAVMTRGGQYVEVEFGKSGNFDDAKNGTYVITFYKCKDSCEGQKYNKKSKIRDRDKVIASLSVVARPGQTNNIVFDAAAKRAFITGRSGGFRVVDTFAQKREEAKKHEGNTYIYAQVNKKRYRFDQVTYLSSRIDFAKFREENILSGIAPSYDKSQES